MFLPNWMPSVKSSLLLDGGVHAMSVDCHCVCKLSIASEFDNSVIQLGILRRRSTMRLGSLLYGNPDCMANKLVHLVVQVSVSW